uniref:Uncharacterized protein n=1 Tax=Heterorhabditis bacteriophora TaxID=37862 RepID=A0A1I7WIM1_HETBA
MYKTYIYIYIYIYIYSKGTSNIINYIWRFVDYYLKYLIFLRS